MPKEQVHNLHHFMRQISEKMGSDYQEIQERTTEDPGTAGDQGEKNWANLLRGWLPRAYEVVTKGRIIGADGCASGQVDVLVLKSIYPKQLVDEEHKMFLAAGVAAAFECKTTLKASHIEEAVKRCVEIKNLYPVREGTPYKELHAPIVYGLLAHSHSWKGKNSTPEENIEQKLSKADELHVSHPRLSLDVLCVADLASWTMSKMTFFAPWMIPGYEWSFPQEYPRHGVALSSYIAHTTSVENQVYYFTPIGVLISKLSHLLAWETPALRDLVDYYRITDIGGSGAGVPRPWPSSIYSESVRDRAKFGPLATGESKRWDEWNMAFGLE